MVTDTHLFRKKWPAHQTAEVLCHSADKSDPGHIVADRAWHVPSARLAGGGNSVDHVRRLLRLVALCRQEPLGQIRHRCDKPRMRPLLAAPWGPEVDDAAAATSGKAVPIILFVIYAQARVPVVVERTKSDGAPFDGLQINIPADELQHGDVRLDPVRDLACGAA
jgi:hypothetical protein